MLRADEAALEKFHQYFGLKMGEEYFLKEMKQMVPDTAVSVLKECFEALRLYDLVEIMEEVKPRSLRPAVSPEQIEKLRRADDRPTKYHSDVAVLVVKHNVEEDTVGRDDTEKIETFFKDLNSRNEVAIISLCISQETREFRREIKERKSGVELYFVEDMYKKDLEDILQQTERLEKDLKEVMQMEKGCEEGQSDLELQLSRLKQQEFRSRSKLENIVKERKQVKRDYKELEKESAKPIWTAMDELIHNQGWLTLLKTNESYN